uniref:Methyltransferase domain-containing protein n=1 Tax=Lotharella oceanica TaxID=641309 RepID=A0A7S2TW14_9EUKA
MGVRVPLRKPALQTLPTSVAKRDVGIRASATPVSRRSDKFGVVGRIYQRFFPKGSRKYEAGSTVANEYDSWTNDGILEHYWGEHIHLGYYTPEEQAKGYKKKNFIEAKFDFIDRMVEWSGILDMPAGPKKVLDVGCGFGGSSRYLAKKYFQDGTVTGITISPNQVKRAKELAKEQGVPNANFELKDALAMDYPDNTFDVVWAIESGEHMPSKTKYVEEMARVLKPGGVIVFATWCQRRTPPIFSEEEKNELQFLYDEWAHPHFVSIDTYKKIMRMTGKLENVESDDWNRFTLPSWRHSIWVGVYDPWIVLRKPWTWRKCLRDGITLERMHRAFNKGVMEYGMLKATKKE